MPAVTCLLTSGSFEAIVIAQWAQYSPDNVTESVHVRDVIDSENSSLGTTFFNYRTFEISRLLLTKLEEVYSLYETSCRVMVQEVNYLNYAMLIKIFFDHTQARTCYHM